MAEVHESILLSFRKKVLKNGFREESKTPMPTYRPDLFAQKVLKNGKIVEEIIAEAEIESTLFSDHTSRQLIFMDEYLRHQKNKKVKVTGYLLIPKNKETYSHAKSLLETLFPDRQCIKLYN